MLQNEALWIRAMRERQAMDPLLKQCRHCKQLYMPTTELEPGMCSLRCALGKKPRTRAAWYP